MSTQRQQAGFTILELMIATTVFSVVLLLITYGMIQIGNRYYKATLQTQTQTATRNVVDEVARNLQFSGGDLIAKPATPGVAGATGAYCINGIQYTYVLSQQQDTSGTSGPKHTLVARTAPSDCAPQSADYFKGDLKDGERDLLANRMRIVTFTVNELTGKPGTFQITLRVASGEDDLLCSPSADDCNETATSTHLTNNDLQCKGQAGSAYCAVSELTTAVTRRISQ